MSTVKSYHPINIIIGKTDNHRNPLPLLLFPPVKECSGKVLCTIKSTVEPPCATASRKRPPTISDYLLTLTESETSRRRDLHTVNMVYKCTHGLAPEYLQNRFVNRVSNYFLRDSSHKFDVPLPRTNYLKNSFRYSGAVLWNGLPSTLRQAESIHIFKSGCKEFFT